jgi:hypothetical protein
MSDHVTALQNALSLLDGIGNVIETASKAREDEALSVLEMAEAVQDKMSILDKAEATLAGLFITEGPAYNAINEARVACKTAMDELAGSADFLIAVDARAKNELAQEKQATQRAEQKKCDAEKAAKQLKRSKANLERFNSLVENGVDIPPKMGKTPKLGKNGEVIKGKFVQGVVREGYNIPLRKLVSVRASKAINAWRDERSNDDDPYPAIPQKVKQGFFMVTLSKVLHQNGIDAGLLNTKMLDEFIASIIRERIEYHAALRSIQEAGIDTAKLDKNELQELVSARVATSGKSVALDDAEIAAGKKGGGTVTQEQYESDQELLAAMESGERDAKFAGE